MESACAEHVLAVRVLALHDVEAYVYVRGFVDGDGSVDMRDIEPFGGSFEQSRGLVHVESVAGAVVVHVCRAGHGRMVEGRGIFEIRRAVVYVAVVSGLGDGCYSAFCSYGVHSGGLGGLESGSYAASVFLRRCVADAGCIKLERVFEAVFSLVAYCHGLYRGVVVGGILYVYHFLVEGNGWCGRHDEAYHYGGLLHFGFAAFGCAAQSEVVPAACAAVACSAETVGVAFGIGERQGHFICAGCHPCFSGSHEHSHFHRRCAHFHRRAHEHVPSHGLVAHEVDALSVIEQREQGVAPVGVGRSAVGDVKDAECGFACVGYAEFSVICAAHSYQLVGDVVDHESERTLHFHCFGGEYGRCFACHGERDGHVDTFAAGDVAADFQY